MALIESPLLNLFDVLSLTACLNAEFSCQYMSLSQSTSVCLPSMLALFHIFLQGGHLTPYQFGFKIAGLIIVLLQHWCYWKQSGRELSAGVISWLDGPLARYAKLRVTHASGMPGMFSLPPLVGDPDMHHSTYVTHMPWCILGSLTSGFLWSRWRGKRSQYSPCMPNLQICISGKRPMARMLMNSYITCGSF